ncbi:conserved membrane hypothetical protein [Vibrio chagasii]|nr:conserved membrane hypothetical protein [Vibrio chagasii]CAH7160552.1 conserved membrane hypothetical protein [Vibrio chagasii]CAH7248961.1 conserved membrane hypothetical protein [Vibrio chagasii]
MRKLILVEGTLSILLGSVPIWISSQDPSFIAPRALAALNPGDGVVNYFIYLFIIHIIVWFLNKKVFKTSETLSNALEELHRFTYQLGFAIHGLYRVFAGAIPVAIGLEIYKFGLVDGWEIVSALSVALSIACLAVSVALSNATEFTAPTKRLYYK